MKRSLKFVAVILVIAFVSPGLWALSNCVTVKHSPEASRCKPHCQMMAMMSAKSGDQILQSSGLEPSCCTISDGAPVTSRAALTSATYVQGNLPPAAIPTDALPAPSRIFSPQKTTTSQTETSSHQALLCVFLV